MPLTLNDTGAVLSGQVTIDDAELFYQWLLQHRTAIVTLRQTEHLHTAIWQLLLMFRPDICTEGDVNDVITRWLLPELL